MRLDIRTPPIYIRSEDPSALAFFPASYILQSQCLHTYHRNITIEMSAKTNSQDTVKHSAPIAINTSSRTGRARSVSVSSASSGSASSLSEAQTPASATSTSRISIPSPGSSPILSYFLAQSPPTKSPGAATFPFKRKFGPAPVFEGMFNMLAIVIQTEREVIEEEDNEVPATTHARRASTAVAGRFAQPLNSPLPDPHLEKGSGLLRRLSLSSSAFVKVGPSHSHVGSLYRLIEHAQPVDGYSLNSRSPPSPPPNTAVSSIPMSLPFARDSKPRRSATISADGGRPRRAPSPMGERILKGHFDGFN